MSDIGAPLLANMAVAAAAETTAVTLGQVALSQVPDRLSVLTRPVVLSGTVTAQSSDGTTVLRTQAGTVAFKTATPLAPETPVTLQVNAGQPPAKANAFVAGAPAPVIPATPPLPTAFGGPVVTTTLGSLAQAALAGADVGGAPTLAPGTVIPGQVLTSPAGRTGVGAAPAPEGIPALVPGTTVAVRILPAAVVGAAPAPASSPALAHGTGGEGRSGLSEAPHPPAAGETLVVESASSDPRPVPIPSPGKSASMVVTGTITGTTPAGQPILTTSAGTVALTTPAALPPGKTLTVQLSDPRQLFVDRPQATSASQGSQTWAPVREALAVLTGQEGGLAQATLVATLPQPDRRLAAALTFALDSVRRGDARGWLGAEAGAALEKAGRHDLTAQLDKAFRTQARQADDTPPGGWRPLAIPMLDAGMIQQIELYVRAVEGDEPGRRKGGSDERSQRFLVNLDLSRLGALQLDGLVRSQCKRFDLILRSLQPLPTPLRAELLGVFVKSLEAVGYTGGLGFQSGARGWVKPAVAVRPTAHRAVMA